MPEASHAQIGRSRRWPVVVSTGVLLAVSLAAGASAQQDPTKPPDTTVTPVAKDTPAWVRIGGAEYGTDQLPPGSDSLREDEFYTVAFGSSTRGFAGGSQCKDPAGARNGQELTDYLDTCPREPVIYEYVKTATGESWRPVLPSTGDGYVGAIAYFPDGRALAVGGTGRYPKRETVTSVADDLDSNDGDGAGSARAWIYERGIWTEIKDQRLLAGMRGMTALATAPEVSACTGAHLNCALAGGYRQMWLWKDNGFVDGWDTAPQADRSPDATLTVHPAPGDASDDGESFRFRVRDVQFAGAIGTKAFAVTSGCCDAVAARNVAAGLFFDGEQLYAKEWGATTNIAGPDPVVRSDAPNGVYGYVIKQGQVSVVATDDGSLATDRASRVYRMDPFSGAFSPAPDLNEVTRQSMSTMRLMAAAGTQDFIDWTVGSLGDGRGIAYAPGLDENAQQAIIGVGVLDCGGDPWAAPFFPPPDASCKPYAVPGGYLEQLGSAALFRLQTYGLNAMEFTDDTESIAWAVGDRGALVRLGGIGTTASAGGEPDPARVRAGTIARLPGSEVYDAFRPLPVDGSTAPVPSLMSNGTHTVERPELVPGGSPNPEIPADLSYPAEDISSMAMSLDGSEGWAVGAGPPSFTDTSLPHTPAAPTLYHYNGSRWSRCDIRGVPGILPADPACAQLDDLFAGDRVRLLNVVRVPLENDIDASNDGEFEVFAVGSNHPETGKLTPLRYRNGQWSVDHAELESFADNQKFGFDKVASVAFTSPTDGWIVRAAAFELAHWDGHDWAKCAPANRATECGDTHGRLPLAPAATGDSSLVTAGKRVYLAATRPVNGTSVPAILYKDPDGDWTSAGGGYDPGCDPNQEGCAAQQTADEQQGIIRSITVSADHSDGWAIGTFGRTLAPQGFDVETPVDHKAASPYYLLRLQNGVWTPFTEDDASRDYLARLQENRHPTPVILDSATGDAVIYMTDPFGAQGPPVLQFDPKRGRWRVFRMPFETYAATDRHAAGLSRTFAADQQGGGWLVAKQNATSAGREAVYFWHYTDEVPNQVFEEAPHPIREQITGGAAGRDGSFWVTTNSGFVYRYDRLTGWDRLRIPGWDPGRVVTRTSEANAVAVGPDGKGLVVGKNGRIAQVSALGVKLDQAAGHKCGDPPCGTGRDLRAVDVAPDDGSALAGGDASVLLYRPPNDDFRKIAFGGSDKASITSISMPNGHQAWLTDSLGQVYAGSLTDKGWHFFVENTTAAGNLLSRDEKGALLGLNAIDIDANGEGYAVGERGLILERRGDAGWQRLKTGFMDTLRSITLAPGGRANGALVGGDAGLILTLEDGEFRVAREGDVFDPVNFGSSTSSAARVRAVAVIPGTAAGETEAWAVQQGEQGPGTVFHYASNGDNPLLRVGGRIDPLPDAPDPRDGEISIAAFGRSECHIASNDRCGEGGSNEFFHEVVARRVATEVIDRAKQPGGPDFALFTGDVARAAGRDMHPGAGGLANTSLDESRAHRRWRELVADRFADAGIPLFGAVGRNDLDRTAGCLLESNTCYADATSTTRTGLTWGWRKAFAGMPAPWGTEEQKLERDGLTFKAVPSSSSQTVDGVDDPVGATDDPVLGTLEDSQARTHYAVDVFRANAPVARLIVLDNSMGTLQLSDPNQNPLEPGGGQLTWLENMLKGVDRAHGQQAIVLMNRPTYSYQVTDTTTWANDATVLEQTLFRYRVKLVVSGRLGWNGRYWATASGLHSPCIDRDYMQDDEAPEPGSAPCTDQTPDTDPATQASEQLADALQGVGAPPPPGAGEIPELPDIGGDAGLQGLIPMVVASSAGGRFGPNGTDGGEAKDGWWHGYTIVRMDKTGDPAATIVEQRPVFDWVSITGASHLLKPRQHMTMIGEGREPVGADVAPRYDRINSYAITHRYDLVLADKTNPSLPARNANGGYIDIQKTMDPHCEVIGCIDEETGVVSAGNGRHERIYTVAILSVGDKVASWPVAFEPAKSYKPVAAAAQRPAVSNPPPEPPPAVVLNAQPASTPPPPPPPPPNINIPQLKLPPPPPLPTLPTPTATPPATPPPPPAPPPPPGDPGALPLSLEAPLTPVSIVPTVIPPSPPPVNPAPPSGSAARKEARQRQAATAKSEEGGGDQQGAGEGQSAGDDGAAQMTRRDPTRPAPSYGESSRDDRRYSFTALSHGEQASAWSRGALYGGMTLATALALALGWGIARPTPRRRHPPRPAPETVRNSVRQRRH